MKALFVTLALLAATPAIAQDATDVARPGAMLIDSTGHRIGKIDRVLADGSLRLIAGDKFVTVPASTVTIKDGTVATSLSKREVSRL